MSHSLRLSLFCAAIFGALGVYAPFWPVWLEARSLSNLEIAVLLSIPGWIRVATAPLLTQLADRTGRKRRITLAAAWSAVISFALFPLMPTFVGLFLVSCAFGISFTALVPMSDQSILAAAHTHGLQYGRIRLWGSLSFLVLAIVAGELLGGRDATVIFTVILAVLFLAAISGHMLPAFDSAPAGAKERPTFAETFVVPGLTRVLFAYGLIMASHATATAFSTLHWQAAGINERTIGVLWAVGVVAEIVLFALGAHLIRRLGPRGLLLSAAGLAALRWAGTATTTSVPLLLLIQSSHAFTFGAAHLGLMDFVTRSVPPRLSTTALGLAAAVSGLFSASLIFASGPLYDRFVGNAFLVMIVPAALAACLVARRLPEAEFPATGPSDPDIPDSSSADVGILIHGTPPDPEPPPK